MSRRQQRKARSVHNPQAFHPNNLSPRVNNSHPIVPPTHPARARSVPVLETVLHDMLQNRLITRNVQAGACFLHHERFHGLRLEERAGALEGLHGEFAICGVRQLVWVYGGRIAGGVRGDVDPATREGCHGGDNNCAELLFGVCGAEEVSCGANFVPAGVEKLEG
jgi:hypothetical protein